MKYNVDFAIPLTLRIVTSGDFYLCIYNGNDDVDDSVANTDNCSASIHAHFRLYEVASLCAVYRLRLLQCF